MPEREGALRDRKGGEEKLPLRDRIPCLKEKTGADSRSWEENMEFTCFACPLVSCSGNWEEGQEIPNPSSEM